MGADPAEVVRQDTQLVLDMVNRDLNCAATLRQEQSGTSIVDGDHMVDRCFNAASQGEPLHANYTMKATFGACMSKCEVATRDSGDQLRLQAAA